MTTSTLPPQFASFLTLQQELYSEDQAIPRVQTGAKAPNEATPNRKRHWTSELARYAEALSIYR